AIVRAEAADAGDGEIDVLARNGVVVEYACPVRIARLGRPPEIEDDLEQRRRVPAPERITQSFREHGEEQPEVVDLDTSRLSGHRFYGDQRHGSHGSGCAWQWERVSESRCIPSRN